VAEPNTNDPLADARESLAEYWEWETGIDSGTPLAERAEAENNQRCLLERAKVSALVSIAESLARIADASRPAPPNA
jgi:hypothetical protein